MDIDDFYILLFHFSTKIKAMKLNIAIKRVYDGYDAADGYRMLVDRLWPRGIKKEAAMLNEWNKTIAPSTELRKWYQHVPEKFEAFAQKYAAELDALPQEVERLQKIARTQKLTLLFSAKDKAHSQALVLQQYLLKKK